MRVATGDAAKKGGLDLASPAADAKPKTAEAGAVGEPSVAEVEDGSAITNPGAVLEGNVPAAEPSKTTTKRRRAGRGGLRVVEEGEGDKPAPLEVSGNVVQPAPVDPEVAKLAADQAADAASDATGLAENGGETTDGASEGEDASADPTDDTDGT